MSARTRTLGFAVALVLVGSSAACTAGSTSDQAHGSPASQTSTSDPTPSVGSPSPMLTPSAPASTPLGAGERVWAAFSQRGLAYDSWWRRLRPQLSDAARAVYVYDDPRNIPSMRIVGKLHLAAKPPAEPRYTAEVVVPTSKGVFRLDLERHKLRSRWLLYAIRFPTAVQ